MDMYGFGSAGWRHCDLESVFVSLYLRTLAFDAFSIRPHRPQDAGEERTHT